MSEAPPANNQPVLRAEELHRFLGEDESRVHVLRGVNLALQPATTYSVVGQSGCGKSTMLYLLGLLDRQDKGKIWIRGELMSDASDAERTAARSRHIGFVFQFHFLLPEFSAAENVMLPMRKLAVRTPDEMRERAEYLLGLVGLGEKVDRLATHLSGGEQQRVAIARSLANDPALLLADEPTGNLDAKNSDMIFNLLQRLSKETGQAILMVTHNTELATKTDACLRMQDGQFID
ncbi:ABC transporter ATP-binding protein [Cerasicoccus fimbriatus]|uniref:ABC transporter ATP-binding protein n=1 Tax=Cerasicoccus fimbriatus TaxID=3014554 RepID=UPI0022B3B21F|nr:ABC transporter ATP-binding protein [Cerasicoccus sp. TK19100]